MTISHFRMDVKLLLNKVLLLVFGITIPRLFRNLAAALHSILGDAIGALNGIFTDGLVFHSFKSPSLIDDPLDLRLVFAVAATAAAATAAASSVKMKTMTLLALCAQPFAHDLLSVRALDILILYAGFFFLLDHGRSHVEPIERPKIEEE